MLEAHNAGRRWDEHKAMAARMSQAGRHALANERLQHLVREAVKLLIHARRHRLT